MNAEWGLSEFCPALLRFVNNPIRHAPRKDMFYNNMSNLTIWIIYALFGKNDFIIFAGTDPSY